MKQSKGFSLIELLAVIVILAIVAVITTPLVLNTINDVKKRSFTSTAYGIIKAAELEYASGVLKNDGKGVTFTYINGVESSSIEGKTLNYKGVKPQNGTVVINNNGEIALAIHDGKWCAKKDYKNREITVTETTLEECTIDDFNNFITIALSNSPVASSADYTIAPDTVNAQQIINQAIMEAEINNLGVYLYSGIYIINDSILLTNNTNLKGEGANTIIKLQDNHPVSNISLIRNKDSSNSNITISNLVIDGNKDNQIRNYEIVNLSLNNVTNFNLNNLEVTGSLIEGIYLLNCNNGIIDNINSHENGYFREDASGIQLDNSSSITISNSIFQNNGFHGILLSNSNNNQILYTTTKNNGWDGVRIQWESKNNIIKFLESSNNFRGIYFTTASETNSVINSTFDANYNGVCFNSSWENIIDNSAINNSIENGVLTIEGADYNYFRNNILLNNANDFDLYYEDQMMS